MRVAEESMRKSAVTTIASASLVQLVLPVATDRAREQGDRAPYPAMAPLDRYLMAEEDAEVALARRGAQAVLSDRAPRE